MDKIMNDMFYLGAEGFLGDCDDSRLLFLLRESNCGDNQIVKENEFWFRRVVQGEKLPWGSIYLSKLGRIAALLFKENPLNTEEEWREELKKSIYVNMNPVSGEENASEDFGKSLKLFADVSGDKCILENELNGWKITYPNRWNIILSMPDKSTIVTVGDIFSIMFDRMRKEGRILSEIAPVHLHIRTKLGLRSMRSFTFSYNGKKITVLETYHPAARGKSSFYWKDISLCRRYDGI